MFSIGELARIIYQRQQNKYDAVIVFDGARGSGKSTGAYKICARFRQFKPSRDIVYSRGDLNHALSSKKYGIIFADEMINAGYKRDFWAEEQKDLIKMLNMYRDSSNVLIMCVPLFYNLDKDLRDLVKIRITVIRRGLAIVQMSKNPITTNDPWDLKNNQKIEMRWTNRGVHKPKYQQLSTFVGFLRFGDLKPATRKLYESIKHEKRAHLMLKGQEKPEQAMSSQFKKLAEVLEQGNTTREELMELCSIANLKYPVAVRGINKYYQDQNSPQTVAKLLKRLPGSSPKKKTNHEEPVVLTDKLLRQVGV